MTLPTTRMPLARMPLTMMPTQLVMTPTSRTSPPSQTGGAMNDAAMVGVGTSRASWLPPLRLRRTSNDFLRCLFVKRADKVKRTGWFLVRYPNLSS